MVVAVPPPSHPAKYGVILVSIIPEEKTAKGSLKFSFIFQKKY
jgi:hypothetical protein